MGLRKGHHLCLFYKVEIGRYYDDWTILLNGSFDHITRTGLSKDRGFHDQMRKCTYLKCKMVCYRIPISSTHIIK